MKDMSGNSDKIIRCPLCGRKSRYVMANTTAKPGEYEFNGYDVTPDGGYVEFDVAVCPRCEGMFDFSERYVSDGRCRARSRFDGVCEFPLVDSDAGRVLKCPSCGKSARYTDAYVGLDDGDPAPGEFNGYTTEDPCDDRYVAYNSATCPFCRARFTVERDFLPSGNCVTDNYFL